MGRDVANVAHNGQMDSRHADLLAQADATTLGRRLRSARIARGLTQGDVAQDVMSVAYLSRIETGQRRPTAPRLQSLAARLSVTVESLLGVADQREVDAVRLELDYAELSLESGEPADAATHLAKALGRLDTMPDAGLKDRARLLHARALEAAGQEDDAILELESLVGEDTSNGLVRIKAGITLSRIYRETGDLGRAIECGERVLASVEDTGLDGCDEAVQLAVTLAAAHFERGDTGHAVRMCRKAIVRAESLGSPMARASAYWNASAMQARKGDVGVAVPLAERALALLSEGQDARNLARLRTEVGRLQLELDPPAIEEARGNLEKATAEMAWSSATPTDRAWTLLGMAKVTFLSGDLTECHRLIDEVHDTAGGHAPLAEAEALVLAGRAHAAAGDVNDAEESYQRAVLRLSAIGADQGAAQLWFDLADLLEGVGLTDASRDAYRRAAVSTGLRARVSSTTLARS